MASTLLPALPRAYRFRCREAADGHPDNISEQKGII